MAVLILSACILYILKSKTDEPAPTRRTVTIPKIEIEEDVRGNIVIIIDDFGYRDDIVSEGFLFALVILFFSILTGMLFRNQPFAQPIGVNNNLTDQEKRWVEKALKENDLKVDSNDPKVIVVKQESRSEEKETPVVEDPMPDNSQYNNPYVYAYPPEYYYLPFLVFRQN